MGRLAAAACRLPENSVWDIRCKKPVDTIVIETQ